MIGPGFPSPIVRSAQFPDTMVTDFERPERRAGRDRRRLGGVRESAAAHRLVMSVPGHPRHRGPTPFWEEVDVVRSVELENVNPWQTPFVIAVFSKPRLTMAELWRQVRPW